jgi:hypothetical protein
MSLAVMPIEKRIRLSPQHAQHLTRLSQRRHLSEDQLIEKALDILFSLTDVFDEPSERQGWASLSERALQRVWNNDEDAIYDNWRELYGVPTR